MKTIWERARHGVRDVRVSSDTLARLARLLAAARTMTAKTPDRRPTIAELEEILKADSGPPVSINPDGSISAPTNEQREARTMLEKAVAECDTDPELRPYKEKGPTE